MMPTPGNPPRDLEDRVIRQTLRQPANLRAFLQRAVPDLAAGFDCEHARLLDRELILGNWRRVEADLPFEIPYRTGAGEQLALVYVLIEHQSDTDPLMPLRTLIVAVGYWNNQWQEWMQLDRPRPPLRLRPVLPIVLYTGATRWGSNRTLADLLGEPEALHAFAPVWRPLFWNLADQTPQALLQSGEGWLQTLAVIQTERRDAAEFLAVVAEASRGLSGVEGSDVVRWWELVQVVLAYAVGRRPAAEREALLDAVVKATPHRAEEIRAMVKTSVDEWLEEGRAEGRAEGQLLATRDMLRRLLTLQFGALPETVIQRIEQTADVDRLKAAMERVLKMTSLDELDL
jgi:hypothetical protein